MSKAIYCDHCEELFRDEFIKKVIMYLQRTKEYKPEKIEFDLCSECFESLGCWINRIEEDELEKKK